MKKFLFLLLAFAVAFPGSVAQECDSNGVCDTHERCQVWKDEGECLRNKEYMSKHCPVACKDAVTDTRKLNPKNECKDLHPRCPIWQSLGECEENPRDMSRYCRQSCGKCNEGSDLEGGDELCADQNEHCAFWASAGECKANPNFMHLNCAKSCDTCEKYLKTLPASATKKRRTKVEKAESSESDADKNAILEWSETVGVRQSAAGSESGNTVAKIQASKQYWESEAAAALPQDLLDRCRNLHELCSFWAHLGECDKNSAYMATNCGPACNTCHLIDITTRCPPLDDPRPALRPGTLNRMFERIVATAPGNNTEDTWTKDVKKLVHENGAPPYTVTVQSCPSEETVTEVDIVQDKSLPPWLITFDNFLTDEECEAMIQTGYKYEYKRSEDVGEEKADGSYGSVQSQRRTSENAWCSHHSGCRNETIPQRIHDRIAEVMQIPPENSEDFQILRYEHNQFYRTHHDYIAHQKDRQCGPRILTFFMYLSDVEEGGGTNFPRLDITVEPKKGRAVLWPSVYNSEPMTMDSRFYHQALPVEKGTKYAVNGWIHTYDYITPQSKGCN